MPEVMKRNGVPIEVVVIKRKLIISFCAGLLICFTLAAFAIQYVGYVDSKRASDERQNDREWCDLIVFYTDYYRQSPPQTELQKQQFALMERRRISLGCK